MRSLMLLKLMIDLFFYGQVLSLVSSMAYNLYNGTFNIGGQGFDNLNSTVVLFMLFTILRVGSFLFAIYNIKELAESFMKDQLFTDRTSRHLKFIGYGIIFYSVTESIGESYSAVLNSTGDTWLSANFLGFNSGWFQFTLGLLFLFMDKVFKNAKVLQQENDLTI